MAEEIVKILKVDATGAVESLENVKAAADSSGASFKTLGEAKKYMDSLRASMLGMDSTSEDYKKTMEEVNAIQEKMKSVMNDTKTSVKGAEGSYNALTAQMAELKKQWKATTDEAERASIGKQILDINTQLKDMDASIGNFQRNVGNYETAFTKGLSSITGQIEALGNPLEIAKNGVISLGKAFKSLILNPVGAAIMAIVGAVKALKSGFEQSETATNAWRKGMAALEPVTNMISRAVTALANIVGDFASKYIPKAVNATAKFLNMLGILSNEKLAALQNEMQMTVQLTEREQKLQQDRRTYQTDEAQALTEIAALREKAVQKDIYNEEQREGFLTRAIALQKKIGDEKKRLADEEYNIALERSKLTDNDAATNDKLAQLDSERIRIQADTTNRTKEMAAQLAEIRRKSSTEAENEAKNAMKIAETEATQSEKIRNEELSKIADINDRIGLELMSSADREIEILTRKYNEEKALLEQYGEDTEKLTKVYQDKVAGIKSNEALGGGNDRMAEIDKEMDLETRMADLTFTNEYDRQMKILDIQRNALIEKKAILEEQLNDENIAAEKKQEIADRLKDINTQVLENAMNTSNAEREEIVRKVQTYADYAQSIASILGSVTGMWQDSIEQRVKEGKISQKQAEEEFEQSKKVQVAIALISGLAGVATALSGAFTLKSGPWDYVLAATQAAAIAVSTAVQISKIKQTKLSSSSSSSAASSTPSSTATSYSPNYSTNVTGQSQTTDLANAVTQGTKDMKVYVLEEDINRVGSKVEVRESESTF